MIMILEGKLRIGKSNFLWCNHTFVFGMLFVFD